MSGPTTPLPDAEARRAAATGFETNYVVQAGAGTGKTSLLVERVLNAVGSGTLRVTELAAITFTEKAAGEMRQRIATGLERLRALARGEDGGGEEAHEADRAFAWLRDGASAAPETIAERSVSALEELDRAVIVTIHSFCAELLRSHPVEAGVDPDFAVDSGELWATRVEELLESFLVRELGPGAERAALWRRLLGRVSLEVAGDVARELAGFQFPLELLESPERCAGSAELIDALAAPLLARIDAFLSRAEGLTKGAGGYFNRMRGALQALTAGGVDDFQVYLVSHPGLEEKVEKNNPPKPNQKLDGASPEEFKRLAGDLMRVARDLAEADDETVRLLVEAAAPFCREVRERYLRQGSVGFDGLLVLARDLLRDRPGVREELKRRFRVLLVDEFQDTDPLQYEIVLFLAEKSGGRAGDAYRAELQPGRLFIVGDPKQSIYRFRGADYAAYREAVRRVEEQGGEVLDLVTNFRSLPGIVDPVNLLFEERTTASWQASSHQPRYTAIHAHRQQDDGDPRVEVWTVEGGGASAPERRRKEGRVIAERIRRLRDDGEAEYRNVSILLRSFTNLSLYLRALRQAGIPFVVDGGREFLQRTEVAQLIAVLQALSHPADQTALVAFLRSPAGAVSDRELAAYAAAEGRWDWRTEPEPGRFESIAGRFALLRAMAEEVRNLPADAAVRTILARTGMLPLDATTFEGAQRVANLRKLATSAGELARDGRLSLGEVVEALREGRLANIEVDSPLADELGDAVRVSTIHRMKGLENRWIFLPDLARQSHTGWGRPVEVRPARTPSGYLLPAIHAGSVRGSSWAWLRQEDRLHDEAEEVRLLYVALTRARDRLVLMAGPSRGDAAWVATLRAWGYDADAPPDDGAALAGGLVRHRSAVATERSAATGEATLVRDAEAVRRYVEAVEAARSEARAPFATPSGLHEEGEREESVASAAEAPGRLGLATGVLLHRLLEEWDGGADEALLTRSRALAGEIARDESVDAVELVREGEAVLEAFLGSELAARFRGGGIVQRELSILWRSDGGEIYRGSIDLLYRDEDGGWVVADYKTDREEDAGALRERYSGQLGIYADAVRAALNLDRPPRRELWMLRTGQRIEI